MPGADQSGADAQLGESRIRQSCSGTGAVAAGVTKVYSEVSRSPLSAPAGCIAQNAAANARPDAGQQAAAQPATRRKNSGQRSAGAVAAGMEGLRRRISCMVCWAASREPSTSKVLHACAQSASMHCGCLLRPTAISGRCGEQCAVSHQLCCHLGARLKSASTTWGMSCCACSAG